MRFFSGEPVRLDASSVRRIRWAVFSFFFMTGLCFSSWASRIPDIKNALGLSDAAWGTVLFMIPLGQIAGMTFSGPLIARAGSRRVLLAAMAGYALTLVCIGTVRREAVLLPAVAVFGFFANFCNIAVNTQGVVLEEFCGRPIMANFHGGWSFAGLVGGAVGLLMTWLGIGPLLHFGIVAGLTAVGIGVNARYLQPDREKRDEVAPVSGDRPERFLFLLGIVGFFGMAAEGAMTDWNGLFLQDVVGVPGYLAPLGLTAYMVTMATGRFVMDRATQRWGRRRVLQFSGAAICTGLFTAVLFPDFRVTLLAFMIVGFGTCGVVPTIYSVTGSRTKMHTGTALTIVSSVSFLGFLLGPPLIGYIAQATSLRYSYALVGLFGVVIVWMASRLAVLRRSDR